MANDWKPISQAPRWHAVEVGGWYRYAEELIWRKEVATKNLFRWGSFKAIWHTHYRELPPPPQSEKP